MPTQVIVHSTFKRFLQVVGLAILLAAAMTGLKKLARLQAEPLGHRPAKVGASLVVASTDASNSIAGRSSVVDADTLEIHGVRIRLEGIDAPESGQRCGASDQEWQCGREAAMALSDWLGERPVTCHVSGADRYQRKLARCFVGQVDIQGWLVGNGWALAVRQYSTDYVADEERASAAKLGVWRGEFIAPWDWRKR